MGPVPSPLQGGQWLFSLLMTDHYLSFSDIEIIFAVAKILDFLYYGLVFRSICKTFSHVLVSDNSMAIEDEDCGYRILAFPVGESGDVFEFPFLGLYSVGFDDCAVLVDEYREWCLRFYYGFLRVLGVIGTYRNNFSIHLPE